MSVPRAPLYTQIPYIDPLTTKKKKFFLKIKAHQPCALTVTEREATGIRARQRDPNRQASRHSNNNLFIKMDFLFLLISLFEVDFVSFEIDLTLIWVY